MQKLLLLLPLQKLLQQLPLLPLQKMLLLPLQKMLLPLEMLLLLLLLQQLLLPSSPGLPPFFSPWWDRTTRVFMYLCEQSYASAQLWCRVEGELVLVWGVRPNASVGGGGGLGLCLRVQGGGFKGLPVCLRGDNFCTARSKYLRINDTR